MRVDNSTTGVGHKKEVKCDFDESVVVEAENMIEIATSNKELSDFDKMIMLTKAMTCNFSV